ncbi:peptidase M48 [Flavobacterium akiainvivens]|uniref:Peptidase M48 n=1 Tax=Flavobacterium akiainvivens TaxID=1202724 RepID=A0A0M8MLF3_9FLAO|nr:M48 family metallopeptidase [Flavobacterium akiainvivens]KOS07958.1 peptidase M48 [Flavobacterium akiainvivens]SFQ61183.1 Peptidase family M48 [Flavobacterium akiainvivens]
MKKSIATLSVFLAVLISSCSTNPFTGKTEYTVVSNSEIFPTAFAQYDQFLKENKVITGTAQANMVKSVGAKIKAAAEKYLTSVGQSAYLKDYAWEYNLVQNDEVNAWCMPGGKIVVYSGILPITKDEAGLATVMGHEVAHALLNHGAKRMSNDIYLQLIGQGVGAAASGTSLSTQQIIQHAYGLGAQYGAVLPFSRSHENEADEIGLTLMAIAGYNPDKALDFWKRMDANSGGNAPMEFMSTHPSGTTRINNITKEIPTAKANAAKFGVKF